MTILRFAFILEVVSDKSPRKPGLIIATAQVIRDYLLGWLF
jgi:hypothetical protein